ncbi:MAG: hydrolase [Cyanophyceae cyanobacterium]
MEFADWLGWPLRRRVAQLLVVRASGFLLDGQIRYPVWEPPRDRLRHLVQTEGVGGVILLGASAPELALRTAKLQAWAVSGKIGENPAGIPLLLAADVEEGVGQRFAGGTWFPPLMALGEIAGTDRDRAIALAQEMGAAIAGECQAVGLNWLLGPVVDVNNNPDNPVINVRAFGETPEVVAELAAAFVAGAQSRGVLTAAKHFPGHGDTATDSHLELPVINHGDDRLQSLELAPFRRAIAAGVDAIMSAHLQIPAWDQEYPATLSRAILTDRLRHQLRFEGLIVTDALVMGAIANRYGAQEASLLALEAGADILLMPADPVGAIAAIVEAVETGRVSETRINESLERIWRAKQRLGLLDSGQSVAGSAATVASNLSETLATQEALDLAAAIAVQSNRAGNGVLNYGIPTERSPAGLKLAGEDAVNLGTLAPDAPPDGAQNLILLDDALSADMLGQHTPAIALPRQWGFSRLTLMDRASPDGDEILDALGDRPTLLQLFVRGNPFRGSANAADRAIACYTNLVRRDRLLALVIYGSPYLLDRLRPSCPYVFSYSQTPQAQAIALAKLNPTAPHP